MIAQAISDGDPRPQARKCKPDAIYTNANHEQAQGQHTVAIAQEVAEANHYHHKGTQDWAQVAQRAQATMPVAAPPMVPQLILPQGTSVTFAPTGGLWLERFGNPDTWVNGAWLPSPTQAGENLAQGSAGGLCTHPFDASIASRGGDALNMIPADQQVPRQDLVGTSPSLSDLFGEPLALDRELSFGDMSIDFLQEVSDADLDAILAMPIDVNNSLEGDGYEVAAQDARTMGIVSCQDGEDTVISEGLVGANTNPAPTQVQPPTTPSEVMQTNRERACHDTDGFSK